MMIDSKPYENAALKVELRQKNGMLTGIRGGLLEAAGCDVKQGELVEVRSACKEKIIFAEVVGLKNNSILLMPFDDISGLCLQSEVKPLNDSLKIPVGRQLLGRIIDPIGNFLDGQQSVSRAKEINTMLPINPLERQPITEFLETGISALDIFCPLGKGQRIGIFAGSGVGKSTLLGMLAKHTHSDINVIALIGERGREVLEFINNVLGDKGMEQSVVVIATAEQPALIRKQAAYTATKIAETFRKEGKDVLLIMDSITRFAMAQREIGIATGEPVGARGYPPSVFSVLPQLMERGGAILDAGSITTVLTVLVEGDDHNEPISDHMRSLLDGHIVLSRDLASRNIYPAIDILNSLSRLNTNLLSENQLTISNYLRKQLSIYQESKDLIDFGAYEKGDNSDIDKAMEIYELLVEVVKQSPRESHASEESWKKAQSIANLRSNTPQS